MRKSLLFMGAIIAAVIFWSALSNAAHSPGGKTGSPGDGSSCTVCHAGTPQTASSTWISHNIPASGYVPGHTYTITLTGTHNGVQRFGFEFTAEDAKSNKSGSFIITNSTETELVNMSHAVSHTGNGLTPSNNSKSWTFDWTAPAATTGDVTFYAALNAANGDNGAGGDVIYLTNLTVTEDVSSGINSAPAKDIVSIFPNPANDFLNIRSNQNISGNIKVLNIAAKVLISKMPDGNSPLYKLDISDLASGVYFVQINTDDAQITRRFIKR
jgi:hypothetical protein